jgi:hypothetical protein
MNVYSDFTIPASGRHVTIFIEHIGFEAITAVTMKTTMYYRVIGHEFRVAGHLPEISKDIIHHGGSCDGVTSQKM